MCECVYVLLRWISTLTVGKSKPKDEKQGINRTIMVGRASFHGIIKNRRPIFTREKLIQTDKGIVDGKKSHFLVFTRLDDAFKQLIGLQKTMNTK